MTLYDMDTLQRAGMVSPADQERSKATVKSLEDFQEGNAFVVGDAQYYGMLQFLQGLAADQSGTAVSFKVYECGEPGNRMFAQTDAVAKMNGYPNGTRFAVFVSPPIRKQHVRAHWVYAERFNGQVLFRDYQPLPPPARGAATAAPPPTNAYLEEFPFSPDSKDKGRSFDQASFIAYVPAFAGQPAPTIADGTPVDAARVAGIIAEVRDKLRALKDPIESPGEKLPQQWPGPGGRTALTEIPAPSAVDAALRAVIGAHGVTAVCSYGRLDAPGVVKVIASPVHGSGTMQKVVGSGVNRQNVNVATDKMTFAGANASTDVVRPGQPAVRDASELAPQQGAPESQTAYRESFALAYQIAAQNRDTEIVINALMSDFTDLIHEATHSFERTQGPMHFREGLTEIFASMAALHMEQAGGGDMRFEFSYNPTYAAYTAAMQELVPLLGLPALAQLQFAATAYAAGLETAIRGRAATTATDIAIKEAAAELLDADGFPGRFRTGVTKLRNLVSGAAPTGALDATHYAPREQRFGAYVDAEAARYQAKYGIVPGADALAKGVQVEQSGGREVAEQRLQVLYLHKGQVTGGQFVELMRLIDGHEHELSRTTGETPDALRRRLLPKATVTFETTYVTKPGEDVYVTGALGELGEWDAQKAWRLEHRGGGVWAGDVPLTATGMTLNYKYLMRQNGRVVWEAADVGRHHARVLPTAAGGVRFADQWGNVTG